MATADVEIEQLSSTQQVMELEKQYVLQNYARYPLALRRGLGAALLLQSRLA